MANPCSATLLFVGYTGDTFRYLGYAHVLYWRQWRVEEPHSGNYLNNHTYEVQIAPMVTYGLGVHTHTYISA